MRDVVPNKLPDLFEGDQLVLLGQYVGEEPLCIQVSGNYLGKERKFQFRFDLSKATTRNSFVARLWASRQIGALVDAIRQSGANGSPVAAKAAAKVDPKVKELVDEIVRLSTEFGILTEYTAFLAKEGTDLTQKDQVLNEAASNFQNRAIRVRSGLSSWNQELNVQSLQTQRTLNYGNTIYAANLDRVSVTTVQQISDRAFYRKGNRWVDSRIVEKESATKPTKVIEFGSEEFRKLVTMLAKQGRQGSVSLEGDILMVVKGEPVLVRNARR